MIVVRTVAELRAALAPWRNGGKTVALVPTMGALHAGHLRLIDEARAGNDAVVLSVFVNPAQFNDPADLAAYPRTDEEDRRLAENADVTVYFAPEPAEVYPPGFTATVALGGPLVETLEGAHRGPQHFHGVTTVVTKLLMMTQPTRAYFGEKDAQQLRVVRALVADLNIDVEIIAVPTVREPDGVALSSRNIRLSTAERATAIGLSQALFAGRARLVAGNPSAAAILADARRVLDEYGIAPEYLSVVDPDTFEPCELVGGPGAVLVLAATVGKTRLIDNVVLERSLVSAEAGES